MQLQVIELAARLFQQHGVVNYSFGFDRAIRRAGVCNYREKRITLSKHLVATENLHEIEQVLLHEIAHALCGQEAGHGAAWKKKAGELGYLHQRIDGNQIASQTAKYLGVCPGGHEHFRSRKPTSLLSCKYCAPKFSARHLIAWSLR